MKIYFATWVEKNQGISLTKLQAFKRLLSYYFLSDGKNDLKHYSDNGFFK